MSMDADDLDYTPGRLRRRSLLIVVGLLFAIVGLIAMAYAFRSQSPTLRRFFASVSLPWESPCERLEKRCGSEKEHIVNIKPSTWVCAGIAIKTLSRTLDSTATLSSDQCAAALVVMERVDEEGLDALDKILEEEGLGEALTNRLGKSGAPGAYKQVDDPVPIALHATGRWQKSGWGGRELQLTVVLTNESRTEVLESLDCKADVSLSFPDKPEQTFNLSRFCPDRVLKPTGEQPSVGTWDMQIDDKWLAYSPNGATVTIKIEASTPFGVHYTPLVLSGEIPGPLDDSSFDFSSYSVEDGVWPPTTEESGEGG